MNTTEYSECLLGINGQMKKVSLKLKSCVDDKQYSNAKKYGWIEKRCGKNLGSWKRMWFILKENELQYYIKEKNLKKRTPTISGNSAVNNNENNSINSVNSNNNNSNENSNNSLQDSISHVNLEGELGKKKEGKGWKVRWMKLLDHSLLYYKSSKDREPLGIINLNECQDCEINKDVSNKFVVVHCNNRYYFKTNTKDELNLWVKAIKKRIPAINQTTEFNKMDLDQFQLKGVIEFSNVLGVQETYKFSSQPNCILISTDQKTYYLSFDSNKEKSDWVSSINQTVAKFTQSLSVRSTSISNGSVSPPSQSNGPSSPPPNKDTGFTFSFKNAKPWRFSTVPSSSSSQVHSRSHSETFSAGTKPSVRFSDSPPIKSSAAKSPLSDSNKKEDFEYGSQILPRKLTMLGPNGGVQVSTSTGAVELSPVLTSSTNNGLINESMDSSDEGDDDCKMMMPESLKNEMMRRSVVSLLKTFKLEIFIVSDQKDQEVFTFVFNDSVLVDQVKAFAFKSIPALQNLNASEYRLGIDEDNLLEVEFLKFVFSNTIVELELKICGIVKLGIFHHRKDRRVKEKLYPDKYQGLHSSSMNNKLYSSSQYMPTIELSKSESSLCTSPNGNGIASSPSIKSPLSVSASTTPILNGSGDLPNQANNHINGHYSHPLASSSPNLSSSASSVNSSPISEKKANSTWQSVNPSLNRRQLISSCIGWNIESPTTNSFSSVNWKPKFDKQEHGFYRKYNFDGSSIVQSFLGVDNKIGPIAFSLAKDSNDNYRGVLHTKFGAKAISEESKNIIFTLLPMSKKIKTKKVVSHLINIIDPTIDPKLLNLASNQNDLQKELLSFEERQTTSGFKFGLVYCRHGQVTDDEIFSNKAGSPDWDEFLGLIGDKIELIGWPHYSAGLDVKFNSTGTHSLYTDYHGNEVMFHVSTMLPFSPNDPQQIERKRQVGNDICVVIFNDGSLSYAPNTITSQFNHVVILVQYDKQNNGYKVSMSCKDGVKTPFEPVTPSGIIKKSDIKDFLLTKLINGELASLQAPVFASKITRTRESLLNYYISQFL
ncbi:hypothetical protein DICPUDRAFT_98586 [Dictyostelium purpureum]|uniref:Pleckstrin domain-containing protein n=1 Tax=Dictyostelium purpureum TaxID=5786 RepID=F0ZRU2_DICPU|nr:uncharacterized protein DICPUDRAFT_98586 [Dictyostelium purpureum]EGC33320.1 hypothetical protein DICPUDRAFT_98586 [Dictyostelium purpureum]|eukprot:XP_003290136.1 hypothetical protein DICPUDRAFT_98586 [Dictyostelium purpureum]